MAAATKPGPIGTDGAVTDLNDGTLVRNLSPLPGSSGRAFIFDPVREPRFFTTQRTISLVEAQNSAMKDPDYAPLLNGPTHCNQATWAIARAVGAPLKPLTDSHGNPLEAEKIRANLAMPGSGYRPVSAPEAQLLANQGILVIVTGPGHVATVRPDNISGASSLGSGPVIANVARLNQVVRLSRVFKPSDRPEVKYFAPNRQTSEGAAGSPASAAAATEDSAPLPPPRPKPPKPEAVSELKDASPAPKKTPLPDPISAKLQNSVFNGVKADRIRSGSSGKVAVIGRSMNDAVGPYAQGLDGAGFKPETFAGDQIPPDAVSEWNLLKKQYAPNPIPEDAVRSSQMFKANQAWAQKLADKGYTVVDVDNPAGQSASPFYEMEKATLFGGEGKN